MVEKIKPEIPLEDRTLLDSLMKRIIENDDKEALDELTGILARYFKKGYDTTTYVISLLKYDESKGRFKFY